MDAALKMVSELKAKITALTADLAEYKSVLGQLRTTELEQEIVIVVVSSVNMKI